MGRWVRAMQPGRTTGGLRIVLRHAFAVSIDEAENIDVFNGIVKSILRPDSSRGIATQSLHSQG
jgi:hypothetical protein